MTNPKVAGKKLGSIEAVKASLKRGGSSNVNYIKHVGEDGMVVRFITEPEEWFGYQEYYDVENKQFAPMVEGEILPDGVRPSFRYLANVVNVETDQVIALKLAKTCANLLMIKYEKYGSMTDRNYELDRHGTGLDTTYDVTPQSPSKMNLSKYEEIDLVEILENARKLAEGDDPFESNQPAMGEVDDEDDLDEGTSEWGGLNHDELFPKGLYREDYSSEELQAIGSQGQDELLGLLEDWDEDLDGNTQAEILAMDQTALINLIHEFQGTEPMAAEDAEDDTLEIDEDDLQEMSKKALNKLAEHLDVYDEELSKEDLIDAILDASEE
jgi:hypothetical protein